MSFPETLISEMQGEYWKLRKLIESAKKQTEGAGLAEREAIELFENCVKYQTFLEGKEIQTRAFSSVAYSGRAAERFTKSLDMVRGEKAIVTYESRLKSDAFQSVVDFKYYDSIEGLVVEAEQLIDRARDGVLTAQQRSLLGMSSILADMEINFIKLFADFRLMSGLNTFGISQRTKVNDDLLGVGLKDVVAYLDHAERNLRVDNPPHWKDALSNCRNSLEETVHGLMRLEKLSVSKVWHTDLAELSKQRPDLLDDATKKMLNGVYGYLSDLGSHAFTKVDKSNIEAVEFGFDQTYRVLAHILLRIAKKPR